MSDTNESLREIVAKRLYEAYEDDGSTWEELVAKYATLPNAWRRAADAAIAMAEEAAAEFIAKRGVK